MDCAWAHPRPPLLVCRSWRMRRVSPRASWSLQPGTLLLTLALAVVYVIGWRRARVPREPHPPGIGRLLLFGCGLVAMLGALSSPLDSLGDQLMVFHMSQHTLLLDVAPILLILGLTKGLLR